MRKKKDSEIKAGNKSAGTSSREARKDAAASRADTSKTLVSDVTSFKKNSLQECVSRPDKIPSEIVALFEAFEVSGPSAQADTKKISSIVASLSSRHLAELAQSIAWDSEAGKSLSDSLMKSFSLRSSDLASLRDGKADSLDPLKKYLVDEKFQGLWFECLRQVCNCFCCTFQWPVARPWPICKFCWRLRMIKVSNEEGSFYVNSLNFSDNFSVAENPVNRAEISLASTSSTTSVSWSEIDMSGSSLSDIQEHDHSVLNDCGSNSHSQIDSHIADCAAHGVSGNLVGDSDFQTLLNKTLQSPVLSGSLSGDALLDDSVFSAASASSVASSRSIKEYVDNAISGIGGATIDDGCVSADCCWSSNKINADLAGKADSSSVPSINDSGTASNEVWSSSNVSEKMRVIKGDFFGGPAYAAGTPFRFNINDLAPTIDVSKVFVMATGYQANMSGDIIGSIKITWNVTSIGSDYIIEIYVQDAQGNPYHDPSSSGPWNSIGVSLQFHAYYADAMPDATFIE